MCVGDWCSPFTWCFYLCKTPCKIPLFFFFLSFPVLWCHTRWRSGDGKLSNCVFLCHSWKGTFPFHSFHWFISTCFLVLQYSSNFLTTYCTSHFTKTYKIFFFSFLPLIDKVLSYIYIYITKKNALKPKQIIDILSGKYIHFLTEEKLFQFKCFPQ